MNNTEKELLTIKDVAEMLKTKVSHIRSMIYHKTIPYTKIGGRVRFDKQTILEWLEKNSVGA